MALTSAFVNAIKKPGKYHDKQGTGLFLLVRPTGGRFWSQRVVIHGKRRELGLGSPPVVGLAEARDQAINNKRTIRNGGDPLETKRAAAKILTFEEAARKAHVELSPTWKNRKDAAAFLSTLERYTFPRFGRMPVNAVGTADVRQAILTARETAPSVAKKLSYRVSAVFKWAIAEQMRTDNPALNLSLPKLRNTGGHMKALPYAEVAGCIDTVNGSGAWTGTKLALEFTILTAARSGEVRAAMWDEIDLDAGVWTVPAERTKMGREHLVPLSPRAMALLEEAKHIRDDSGLIFPSVTGKVMSDMTLSKLVRELGFDAHVHGFRASFRTWAQEKTNTPREIAEAALAYVSGDLVERAYARSDFFEKRRVMMESWSGYLKLRSGEVLKLGMSR